MNEKVYYDACAFIHFFETPLEQIQSHRYSPKDRHEKGDINIISPFVLEEYFHTHFAQKVTTNQERIDRIDKLMKIQEHTDLYFDLATRDIKLDSLAKLYFNLFLVGVDLGIVTKNMGDGNLHSYDFLHLSYCMLANADIFLTSDSGFKKLFTTGTIPRLQQKFEGLMKIHKLKKIALYSPDFRVCKDFIIRF